MSDNGTLEGNSDGALDSATSAVEELPEGNLPDAAPVDDTEDTSNPAGGEGDSPTEGSDQATTQAETSSSEATPPEPSTPTPRRFKVKVDGAEQEVDEEELLRGYQMSKAAAARLKEATDLQAAWKRVHGLLPERPFDVLQDVFAAKFGDKQKGRAALVEMAARLVNEELQRMAMPEPERRMLELQETLRQREEQVRQYEEREKRERAEAEHFQRSEQRVKAIRAALKKENINEGGQILAEVSLRMTALEQAGQEADAATALALYLDDMKAGQEQYIRSLPTDKLLSLYPDIADKVAQARIQAAKDKRNGAKAPVRAAPSTKPRRMFHAAEKPKPVSWARVFNEPEEE